VTAPERSAGRVLVVRHGESEANVVGSLHCSVPGPGLTAHGFDQAEALVGALADEDIDAVWASNMTRAQQTAAPLAAARGLDVGVHPDLREAYLGTALDDRRDAESHEVFDAIYAGWMLGTDPDRRGDTDGESGAEIVKRWSAAFDEVVRSTPRGRTALLISHGAASRLAVAAIASVDPAWALTHRLPNTGWIVLDSRPTGWHCARWADVEPGS
jgi:broad specificity phosphatase PhoE